MTDTTFNFSPVVHKYKTVSLVDRLAHLFHSHSLHLTHLGHSLNQLTSHTSRSSKIMQVVGTPVSLSDLTFKGIVYIRLRRSYLQFLEI